jgi:O-6-methylguanine DNA methyltransferase
MNLDFLDDYPPAWRAQIHEYLSGKRRIFDIKLRLDELDGTKFQKAVWGEMMKIPYGKTRCYQEIAVAIGRPQAVRAVGTACGANKYPLIIPCHRVVAKHGLGGFALGLNTKKKLLELEGIDWKQLGINPRPVHRPKKTSKTSPHPRHKSIPPTPKVLQ